MKILKHIDKKSYVTQMLSVATLGILSLVWAFIQQMPIVIITLIVVLVIVASIIVTFAWCFNSQKKNVKRNKIAPENKIKLLKIVEAEIIKKFPPEDIEDAMKAYGIPEPKSIHEIPVCAKPDACLAYRIRLVDSNEHARIAGELGLDISDLLE